MRDSGPSTEARERVLEAAERLFAERGYSSVTLRDIAADVGIRHTSLYHHVPGGKEELFIEVTERTLQRHRDGLTETLAQAAPDVRAQLQAAANWLLSQPPMDLIRMVYSDMPSIDPAHAGRLSQVAYDSMLGPIEAVLAHAGAQGEIEHHNFGLIAGGILGMLEALHAVPQHVFDEDPTLARRGMAYELIDTLLNGLRKR